MENLLRTGGWDRHPGVIHLDLSRPVDSAVDELPEGMVAKWAQPTFSTGGGDRASKQDRGLLHSAR